MSLTELYLSRPGIHFPGTRLDNEAVVERVRAQFRGSEKQWKGIRLGIHHIFNLCGTKYRYMEGDMDARVADYAAAAARKCLEITKTSVEDVDLLICGGIPRQYFEPATAMEVGDKLGLRKTHAFDVTSACVGHLEAIQTAAAYMNMHNSYRSALICTAELSYDYINYDIQSVNELRMKGAGLTVGNGAACMMLTRDPPPGGGLRLLGFETVSDPRHWELCLVPIGGKFESSSVELMRLGEMIPPITIRNLKKLKIKPEEVDHYVFHQPSEGMVRKILEDMGADGDRGVYTHHLYGNTASASVGVTLDHLLATREVKEGDKIFLGSAAAGFSVVMTMGVWTEPGTRSAAPSADE